MRKSFWKPLMALAVGFGLSFCSVPSRAAEGDIAVGGEMLMRVRVGSGGKGVKERADLVTDRLPVILAMQNLRGSDVTIQRAGGKNYNIMVRKRLLITVTPEDGKANGVSARQQAENWAAAARRVIPRVSAQENPNAKDG